MAAILIVEDDAFIREIAGMHIQEWGHQTLSASGVDDARALLRSAPRIDALFTDVYLKTGSFGAGCSLVREAIKLWPNLRVLYTTQHLITYELTSQFVSGTRCIRNPYTMRQLKISIENLLATDVEPQARPERFNQHNRRGGQGPGAAPQ